MTAIKKRGRWYFRKRVRGHGRIFVTPSDYGLANTKVAAEESGRRRIAELLGERRAPAVAPLAGMTLAAFEPIYLEHSDAKNEYATTKAKRQILRDHLIPAFGPLPMSSITFDRVEDFKNRLVLPEDRAGLGLKAKTANNILSVLHRALELARKRGEVASVPDFEWLTVDPSGFDFLSPEEVVDLVDAADGEWGCMILVGARCGLRQSELLALRWEDVDTKNGRIVVRWAIVRGRLKRTKNRKIREVPLGDDVCRALAAQRHLRGPYVFCDADGNHLTNGECKHPLYRACSGARLRRIGWHVLRHTFASQLAMAGVDAVTIKSLLGHSTLRMTERYMHLSPNVARDAVQRLDGARLVPNKSRTSGKRR